MRSATFAALVVGMVASMAVAQTPAPTRTRSVRCDTSTACFPWSTKGPYCGRGANLNLRFQLQLTRPNFIPDSSLPEPISNVTYAFCPRVDELQAFNITNAGSLALTYQSSNGTVDFMTENERYLSIIGMGDTSDVNYPQPGSEGRVMIADYLSAAGEAGAPQCLINSEIGVVTFLIFNISLDNGRFKYYGGHPQPAGVGFVPSCDSSDVCLFDSSMKCIGEPGRRNCAECMTREQARDVNVQVWVSYYGTDASGRTLRSGANNPLNFQAYSGSGVSSSMRRSFNNIQNGRSGDPDGLEPASRRWSWLW